ncbi:sensor histidine kinase [Nocardia sp. NPDC057440]|uniref:sensor histidine kinase n=1 Tax=Nocardia sp. NPDC057440 TaxID=3346134 RepID=UPI00366C870A
MRRQWSALSAMAQDALIAVFVFAFGATLYVAGLYPMTSGSIDPSLTVRFGVLALMCAVSLLRRRIPMWALALGLVPLGIDLWLGATVPIWIMYSDLIYAAVLYASPARSRFVVAAGAVLSAVAAGLVLVLTGDWRVMALAITAAVAFIGSSIWWALSVRHHREIAGAERARAQALSLVAELDRRAAIADERKTMARDLHDVIAGHLSAIALQSEAALGVLSRQDSADPAVTGIVGSIRSNSVSALQEMRTMIGLLRRDDGAEDDPAAPRRLAQLPILVDAAQAAGITVRVTADIDGVELPSAVDQAAYRIVQEALTNAMKHAPGQAVDIDVSVEPTTVAVLVRNQVRSTPRQQPEDPEAGRGLANMRERAAALGGSFAAGPAATGWEVLARLPTSTTKEMS